ncbi:hypothetical protein PRIPAC_77173 [Pristionchus pacificus]|uniref:Uncharacterized protein n=1 Tax=Pristionchus pacificus TaxID=54126 RepID=A0A2A6CMG1_PRIPA|nr:hypothetical protein PRIPAC_77173 [Pristionchus pacificus]|eukprot:PDM79288.1 hypothetical protein PRIPAC_31867 [Pristionchus pacificus]
MNCADNEMNADTKFFSQPTINVTREWLPMMREITELVTTSLKRFPQCSDIDFSIMPINESQYLVD